MKSPETVDDVELLAVTGYPPCNASGGGVILRSLLLPYPRERLTVITSGPVLDFLAHNGTGIGFLDVPHHVVRTRRAFRPTGRRLVHLLNLTKIVSTGIWIAWRTRRDGVILASPTNQELGSELFVAAYVGHLLSRAPLVIFEMDDWRATLTQGGGRITRTLERFFHRPMLRAASTVWAISEQMSQEFAERFGVRARVMTSSVDVDAYDRGRRGDRVNGNAFRILFTGMVYSTQAGAIRNVVEAIHAMGEEVSLTIYTGQSAEELAANGVSGPKVDVRPLVPVEAIPDVLATADALLLPFSFEPAERSLVSTSLPTKTADYLASGVPILVHAPPYATIARLAGEEGWAEVVDAPSVEAVTAAIRGLMGDDARRAELADRALAVARKRHDLTVRRREFFDSIVAARMPRHRTARAAGRRKLAGGENDPT